MRSAKKTVLIIISVLASILCVLCCLYIYQFYRGHQRHNQIIEMAKTPAVTQPEEPVLPETEPEEEKPEEPEEPQVPTMAIDIDFDALSQVNEEIYAWLEVPGTIISYPILQSATDDLFYNTHGVDKSYFTGGSIYSQRHNTKTFEDPMTLVYGHNFHDQSLFAPLLNFRDTQFFQNNHTMYVYTPEKVFEYEIFAAYPHTSEHLLVCYDFADETSFNSFFDSLTEYTIDGNFNRDSFPQFGDRVLTLSTCYRLTFGVRYLVQGVLREVYQVENVSPEDAAPAASVPAPAEEG